MVMRLDKLLAKYGIGTRKEVKNFIRKGFVTVNGVVVKKDDFKVDIDNDEIYFEDEQVIYQPYVYLMLNKPQGYVSATKDNVHHTVLDLIDGYENYELFPVGRLDIDTEGLLLITNDGDFAHRLTAPSRKHGKLYYAQISGIMNQDDIASFETGVVLSTGYKCKPAKLNILSSDGENSEVEIEIAEGKFHQVKKMVEACGKQVTFLKRTKIKNLELDQNLSLGDFRELQETELVDLMSDL